MDSDATKRRDVSPNVVVRPIGYVEDEPIIRRIGDRNLYLGNALAADSKRHDEEFDAVLSATRDRYALTTHHRPLVDGEGNDWAAFERAVDTARSLYRSEGSTLVHCKAGISRSSALVAAAIAAEENLPFLDALAIVQMARPPAIPHPALHELGVIYLACHS